MPQHHTTQSKTSPGRLQAFQRQTQALELRIAGLTFPQIAEALGYSSRQGAFMAVDAALMRTQREPADKLRTVDLERLDRLLESIWPKAVSGDYQAVAWVLRIMERRAKLLGLDEPVKIDLIRRVEQLADEEGLTSEAKIAAVVEAKRIMGVA